MSKIVFALTTLLLSAPVNHAEVLASGWVPNALLRQGQVSLVSREDGTRVEVLLNSRFMDRVVNRIIGKEQNNWPANQPDAMAYIKATIGSRKQLQEHDGVEVLQIVFSLMPAPGLITWRTGSVRADAEDRWHLQSPVEIARIEPSREYLIRNAVLILADSLGFDERKVREMLAERLDSADLQFVPEVIDD